MGSEEAISRVFDLYERHGHHNYQGERVSQLEHAVQCAMYAERDGATGEVIIGALFHDVGHLLALERDLPIMMTEGTNLGAQKHDAIGGEFLRSLGFPEIVCKIAAGHVKAKRYLVTKDTDYHSKLSDCSKMTLVHQGGSMTSQEAVDFEGSVEFDVIFRMRTWDDQAKVEDLPIEPLDKYKNICRTFF